MGLDELQYLTGLDRQFSLFRQRKDGHFVRREARVQTQDRARFAIDLFLVVGRQQERHHRTCGPCRRLDAMRHVALVRTLVEEFELLAGVSGMLLEVEVATVGDALEFTPSPRERKLDVGCARRIMREFVGIVRANAQLF